jgi:hypothetical protein
MAAGRDGAHIGRMVERFRARLLEVKITSEPPLWRWQVFAGSDELSCGSENAQIKASFERYNAMFHLLAAGWNP